MARKRKDLPVPKEEWDAYIKKAKAANQRLASMMKGQKKAVEYYTHGEKFSRAIPETQQEFRRMNEKVERFLRSKQTTRTGWKEIKKKAVEHANKTLAKDRHYDFTDDELANILEEIETKEKKVFYQMLDMVQAKKEDTLMEGSKFTEKRLQDAINEAVEEHLTAGEAVRKKTAARKRAGIESKKAKALRKSEKRYAKRRPKR